MRSRFVIVTHAVLSGKEDVAGPAHTLVSYLNKRKAECLFIRHPLFGSDQTLVGHYKDNVKEYEIRIPKSSEILQRLFEGFITLKETLVFSKNSRPVYVGIDPLNSLWGLILKKLGKIIILISFTVDYSPARFNNKILNFIYHLIDRITLKGSDEAWVVSKRIYELRLKQGKDYRKVHLVPNAPPFNQVRKIIKKNPSPFNLITIGTISKAHDFNLLIDVLDYLVKKYKGIKLTIIGAGEGMEDFKDLVNKKRLKNNVILLGRKSHEEVFKIISEHGVGIALYTDDAPWSYYSDSMKARDYLALGLPVIISGNLGTTQEIKDGNAGIVIKRRKDDIVRAVESLVTDRVLYNNLRENALKLAKKNDIDNILNKALKKYL